MIGRSLEALTGASVGESDERPVPAGRRRDSAALFGRMFSWLRPPSKSRSKRPSTVERHIHLTNPWHAVSIATNKRCCQASLALKHRRFLSHEAPRLPLEACTQPAKCICVYKHFDDRRTGSRRTAEQESFARPRAKPAAGVQSQERRRSKGRRATD